MTQDTNQNEQPADQEQSPCYASYVQGLERAAQIARYYLKHQNLPCGWDHKSEREKGMEVTAENIEELINEEAELPESDSRFNRHA